MATYSLSFLFRQFDRGWSENFFIQTNASVDNIKAGILTLVVGPSTDLRHPSTILQGYRLRDLASPRRSKPTPLNAANPGSAAGTNTPDIVSTALRASITSTNGPSRSLWIRGLNDRFSVRNSNTGAPDFSSVAEPMRRYLTAIRTLGGCVRTLVPAGTNDPPTKLDWQNVNAFSLSTRNALWTTCVLPDGAALPGKNEFIYFRGLQNPRDLYLRGRFRVMDVGANFIDVAAQFRGTQSTACANTQWRKSDYSYAPFETFEPADFSDHQTGGPSVRARGRRSPQVRRQLTRAG